ncbi:MAG: hypothetical protein E3K37_03795 [Candidatus Kuenenia sp.]|nr:hypothetical protein [Candidatus Kuenenia hertensis]
MLNAMARVADNTNVVANIAALVPHYNPKKEAVRKMNQVQPSNHSNKSNVRNKGEKDSPQAEKYKSKGTDTKYNVNSHIDLVV